MRRILIPVLALGVVLGFGSGFSSLASHHGYSRCHGDRWGQWQQEVTPVAAPSTPVAAPAPVVINAPQAAPAAAPVSAPVQQISQAPAPVIIVTGGQAPTPAQVQVITVPVPAQPATAAPAK